MKIATLVSTHPSARYNGKAYSYLILENIDDVVCYEQINAQIKSHQAVGFWRGFMSQKFRDSPVSYAAHEVENDNGMAFVLATHMSLGAGLLGKGTSLVEYCSEADAIITDIHQTMRKFIIKGNVIRVQQNGGYCPLAPECLSEYINVSEINEMEMYNYLLNGQIDGDFKIKSSTIVIENSSRIPTDVIGKYCKLTHSNKDDLQVITSFKHKSILFKEEDFFRFFKDGFYDHNLTNIVFKSSAQDTQQIIGIQKVLEYFMKRFKDRTINIYADVYESSKPLFQTELKNINVIFLK